MFEDMKYNECEKLIYDIPKFTEGAGPDEIGKILFELINEDDLPEIIHAAGTNGKGSVCAYMKNILMDAGYRVGFFISPHLVTMRERICINDEMISEEAFVKAYQKVTTKFGPDDNISYFALLFLMAMVYFDEERPDYIILETGLGGRLDATNSINKKKLCIITEIGLDHTQYLGETYAAIAKEKAGILRNDSKAVFCDKRKESTDELIDKALKLGCEYTLLGKNNINNVRMSDKISYDYIGNDNVVLNITVDSMAYYQIENSALACMAALLLDDPKVTKENIKNGIASTHWTGRMQKIDEMVYIDGAHNEDGIEAFLKSVSLISGNKNNFLIFGVMSDKDYPKIIRRIALSGLFKSVYIVEVATDRSLNIEKNREQWQLYEKIEKKYCKNVNVALDEIKKLKNDEEYVYIAGSLYMIGEVLGNR